jgi:hypothetical protein
MLFRQNKKSFLFSCLLTAVCTDARVDERAERQLGRAAEAARTRCVQRFFVFCVFVVFLNVFASEGQRETCQAVLEGKSVLALLPTGGGKGQHF